MDSKLRPLAPDGVKLLPGLFRQRFEINRQYLMSLKPGNLLQNHYLEAGLWQSTSLEGLHGGWESPSCELRGHFLGHWLSAAARIYATTGDQEIKARADHIVSELGRCQRENGGEWAGSIPPKYLEWIAEGKKVWAPHYTVHKTLMGLHDMFALAGNQEALDIVTRWANWFHRWTGRFSRQEMDEILDVETGGMLEVWANLFGITGNEKHLDLVRRYDRPRLFDPLLCGEDVLTNRHANTTIPEIHGAARAWEVTGERRWRDVVEAYWRLAVTERGFFCTGGQTCGEVWTPPFQLATRRGDKNQEHCTVYNMMRLAEYLLRWTGDARYADYWEPNLYNGILAQQHPETGMVAYFLPMRAGSIKNESRGGWSTPTNDFWCCVGTLVQAHTMHTEGIYYEDEDGLVVCQYIPTSLSWARLGVHLDQTLDAQANKRQRPECLAVNLQLTCERPAEFAVHIRLPWWLAGEPRVVLNGEPQPSSARKAGFLSIWRTWESDRLHVELPRKLVRCPLPDEPDTVAFLDGPIVLAGLCGEERALSGDRNVPESLLAPDNEREWNTWLTAYRARAQERGLRFVPLYQICDERYAVYFPVYNRLGAEEVSR